MRLLSILIVAAALGAAEVPADWKKARDSQDRAALDRIAADAAAQAKAKPKDASAQYRGALAQHLRAEVAMEARDRKASADAAVAGIAMAEQAVALAQGNGEYRRLLGTLCGQVIPANVLAGMQYGKCAMDEVNKAVELSPRSPEAWLSRGVGNYYLPAAFGGGPELAMKDFEKSISLDPKNADAYLWLGLALRKLNRNADARKALETSLSLNPNRLWAKQQLEKTPAK